MNRRHFLQVLSSGVVGLSLVETEWIPTPIISTAPLPATFLKGLEQITPALARDVGALLNLRAQFEPRNYSLGMGGMREQFCVGAGIEEWEWERGVERDRIVAPMAHVVAERIRNQGIGRFGALPIPTDGIEEGLVATDQQSGVTIRGLRAYVIGGTYDRPIYPSGMDEDDEDVEPIGVEVVTVPPYWMTRFDIIGGPAA